jgi:hypothetical protein
VFDVSPKDVKVALSQKARGVEKYNGVDWWYWLANLNFASATSFCIASYSGLAYFAGANLFGGCASRSGSWRCGLRGKRLAEKVRLDVQGKELKRFPLDLFRVRIRMVVCF